MRFQIISWMVEAVILESCIGNISIVLYVFCSYIVLNCSRSFREKSLGSIVLQGFYIRPFIIFLCKALLTISSHYLCPASFYPQQEL